MQQGTELVQAIRHRVWLGYALAVALPLAGYAVRLAVGETLIGYPFATFYPVILCLAMVAPVGACLGAVGLSAVLAGRFAVDSGGSHLPQSLSAWIGLALFLVVALMIVGLLQALRQTRTALAEANAMLEARVAERTRDLTEANARLQAETAAREAAEA